MLPAVDKSLSSSLADARDALINAVVDMLTAYRSVQGGGQSSCQLLCPYQLRHVALYVLAMLKSVSLGDDYLLLNRVFCSSYLEETFVHWV